MRVVGEDGSHSDGNRVDLRAELVHAPARCLARHPAAVGPRHTAVEGQRELQDHERPLERDPRPPCLVLLPAAEGELAVLDRDRDTRG